MEIKDSAKSVMDSPVLKLIVLVVSIASAYYATVLNQDRKNAEVLLEIQYLRADLKVYIAQAEGKNALQDQDRIDMKADIADLKIRIAQISREGTLPKPITVPNNIQPE